MVKNYLAKNDMLYNVGLVQALCEKEKMFLNNSKGKYDTNL